MRGNMIEFQVSGDYALFSDPVTRVGGQKCSYPIPTYEALKGIVKAVYWKPTLIWFVDAVRVMNPIRMFSKGIRPIHYQDGGNDLAYYTYLDDVRYQVRAHFEWNMNRPEFAGDRDADKHLEIAEKAIRHGGRRPVFLGTSECQGLVEPCVFGQGDGFYDGHGTKGFGIMVHSLVYPDEAYSDATQGMLTLNLWNASMTDGVVEFPRPDVCTMSKTVRPMSVKQFESREVKAV